MSVHKNACLCVWNYGRVQICYACAITANELSKYVFIYILNMFGKVIFRGKTPFFPLSVSVRSDLISFLFAKEAICTSEYQICTYNYGKWAHKYRHAAVQKFFFFFLLNLSIRFWKCDTVINNIKSKTIALYVPLRPFQNSIRKDNWKISSQMLFKVKCFLYSIFLQVILKVIWQRFYIS